MKSLCCGPNLITAGEHLQIPQRILPGFRHAADNLVLLRPTCPPNTHPHIMRFFTLPASLPGCAFPPGEGEVEGEEQRRQLLR